MTKMTKTYPFNNRNIKPEFIGNSNKVRMRIVDQTSLDTLLTNDSISLNDYKILDRLASDYNKSGMVGIKATNFNPRIATSYDTNNDSHYILKRKVYDCLALVKSAGGINCYNVLMKLLTDRSLSRIDIEFIKNNTGEIVKPIKEFYESWSSS